MGHLRSNLDDKTYMRHPSSIVKLDTENEKYCSSNFKMLRLRSKIESSPTKKLESKYKV